MGRTPVREALLRLQKEGLIEIFPRKGMRVSPFTKKNISDLYQARKLLEPTVMTSYLSLYAKSTLLDYQVRFENSLNDDPLTHFELDAQFHTYLISITQNDILMDMYHTLMVQQIRLAMYADLKTPEDRPESLAQHRAIIDALLREIPADVTLTVLAGRNAEMKRELDARYAAGGRVTALPFTDRVDLWMHASDMVITKPGGISTTEAAASRTPLIHTEAIPGCETKNAELFERLGMSMWAKSENDAARCAALLLDDPARAERMTAAQAANIDPHGAANVADLVERL